MYVEEEDLIMMEYLPMPPTDLEEFEDLEIWSFVSDILNVVHRNLEYLYDIVDS
jgi:hypothetical protein